MKGASTVKPITDQEEAESFASSPKSPERFLSGWLDAMADGFLSWLSWLYSPSRLLRPIKATWTVSRNDDGNNVDDDLLIPGID